MNPLKEIRLSFQQLKKDKDHNYVPRFDYIVDTKQVYCYTLGESFTVFICKESASGKNNIYHTFVLAHELGRCYMLGNELPILMSRQIKNKFISKYNDRKYYFGKNKIK